jgi:hypothetical protein
MLFSIVLLLTALSSTTHASPLLVKRCNTAGSWSPFSKAVDIELAASRLYLGSWINRSLSCTYITVDGVDMIVPGVDCGLAAAQAGVGTSDLLLLTVDLK